MVTKQKKLNEFDDKIKAPKIKVYLAGGWFDKYQIKAISYLEKFLSSFDEFEVFISKKEQDKVFKENLKQIDEADIVIVSTVGKDITTLFEAGYAKYFAKNYLKQFITNKLPIVEQDAAVFDLEEAKQAKADKFLQDNNLN